MKASYLIPQTALADLEQTVARLAKRAARLKLPPITMNVGERVQVPYLRVYGDSEVTWVRATERDDVAALEAEGRVRYRPFHRVEVCGETPRVAGWEFVATLQHLEGEGGERLNMLRVVPGHESRLPERFRTAGPENCDHCRRTIRTRRDTFVVRWAGAGAAPSHDPNGDGWQQVGRTCTQDFLGGIDPHAAAAALEALLEVCGAASAAEDDGEGGWGGGRGRDAGWPIREFLGVVAALVRRDGWVSRGEARKRDCAATADDALYYLDPPRNPIALADWRRFVETRPVTDADRADALAALEYARGELCEAADLSDYLWNLRVACAQPSVDRRTAGITASLVSHWRREVARRVEASARPSRHVGQVGERVRVRVTLSAVRPLTGGMYESYLHKFRSDEGDALCWFAGSTAQDLPGGVRGELVPGQTYWLRGTVKSHNSDLRFGKETVLTRCTVLSDEQVAEENAKAAKKAECAAKKATKGAATAGGPTGATSAPAPAEPKAAPTYSDRVPF